MNFSPFFYYNFGIYKGGNKMNKIGKGLLPELKEKINKVEIIPVEIDGQQFEVEVQTFLSTELRDKLMKYIQINSTEENVEKFGAEMLGFYSIFQTITNIEFGEELESGMELFVALSDIGVVTEIVEKIPEKLFNDITNALNMTRDIMLQMAEQNEII
jgi:hypothetical protein